MRKTINVPPPADFSSFSHSELFRYFFQIGRWTEDSFSDEFQNYTRGTLVSTVTINKWKNRDVIPRRYSGPLFKLIESLAEPDNAATWITAFEMVWARHSSGRPKYGAETGTPAFSDTIRVQHQRWINHLYTETREGDIFSPANIYVPLQLSDARENDLAPQEVEDVIERLNETEKPASDIDWVFISGGPGSGKTMTALRMATLISETDIFPIYIRGSRLSNIDIDIIDPKQAIEDVFSTKSFLRHFRASSFDRAILILDGLDEINSGSHGTPGKLEQLLSELKNEQSACAAHNKSLKVVAFGRDAHIQFSEDQVQSNHSLHLALLSLDGSRRNNGYSLDTSHGQDLRGIWWGKYLAATNNIIDPSLPDFLTTDYDDFSEFGSDPLLSYLVCHTALNGLQSNPSKKLPHERVNELTYSANKNEIYQTIFDRLALDVRSTLDPRRFRSILQHIALAIWHNGDSQSVSLKSIFENIQNPETKASFQALSLSGTPTQTPPDTLITAFYYRLLRNVQDSEQSLIEFTHKSFPEYLTSTLIFDRFIQLISAMEKEQGLESALKDWASLSRAGPHSPSLADFCQKEATLRYESLSHLDWDLALKISQRHIHGPFFSGNELSIIAEMQHSTCLLFFIWSCLNLERQKRTEDHFSLPNSADGFSVSNLKSIQRPNGLTFESGAMTEPSLRDMTFLTPTLSALQLTSADMSQLSFSLGHIENFVCDDTNFAMTYWSHVKITVSRFTRSVFQQAIFHQWRVIGSIFSHCFFQGSRFQGATFSTCQFIETYFSQCHFSDVEFNESQLKNVIFDRCVFTKCSFEIDVELDRPLNAKFRHCTFMDMEQVLENIPEENIHNPISHNGEIDSRSQAKDTLFKTSLEKLL